MENLLKSCEEMITIEVEKDLVSLKKMTYPVNEEILFNLHFMYLFRYVLPTFEPLGTDYLMANMDIIKLQVKSCMMGRFLDDLIDNDSGFWNNNHCILLYSHYLASTLESANTIKSIGPSYFDRLLHSISLVTENKKLYSIDNTKSILCPNTNPLPLSNYPDRIPYFWNIFLEMPIKENKLKWSQNYITSLFYLYDLDDVVNDILNNIPTTPAYEVIKSGVDVEGKIKNFRLFKIYQNLLKTAIHNLNECRLAGLSHNYELGPRIIQYEIDNMDKNSV